MTMNVFFTDKASERGDAVASSIEDNVVQWRNRHVIRLIMSDTAH